MSILQYLKEGIYATVTYDGEDIEIFDDPSKETIDRIIKKAMYKDVRFAINLKGEIFCWDGLVIHADVKDQLPQNIKWTLHFTNIGWLRHDFNPKFEGREIDNATFKRVAARLKSLFDNIEVIELLNKKSIGDDKLKILKQNFPIVYQTLER